MGCGLNLRQERYDQIPEGDLLAGDEYTAGRDRDAGVLDKERFEPRFNLSPADTMKQLLDFGGFGLAYNPDLAPGHVFPKVFL